jgi:hypothetical protein
LIFSFPLDKVVFAAKILGYGTELLKSVPTFESTELHLRESGIGNERFQFAEFCTVLKVYLAYHGKFNPLTIAEFFSATITLLHECNTIKDNDLKVSQSEFRTLEDAFKLSLKRQYGKASVSPSHPSYTVIRDASARIGKSQVNAKGSNVVATMWYEFAHAIVTTCSI